MVLLLLAAVEVHSMVVTRVQSRLIPTGCADAPRLYVQVGPKADARMREEYRAPW